MNMQDIKSVFSKFRVSGSWQEGAPTGSGHIHGTWLIQTTDNNHKGYILQKINNKVFPPVEEMMDNIQLVTTHIKKKNRDGGMQVLEIINTVDGKNHLTDHNGNYWRLYRRICPGYSYDTVPNKKVACEAGKAFGQFIADLRDLPSGLIFPVIPGFHSIEMRYENFRKAVDSDLKGRVEEVRKEIDFANSQIDKMRVIPRLEKEGKLPVRITHNDTKLNNVLFDENDNAVCVIDLDTVMPGLSLYDFGDTIRTAANTGEEDEADLGKIEFSLPVFRSFTEGFLEKTISFLSPEETELLPLASQYMTYIMGIRFLTDYIEGDQYYSTHYEKQNLRRCRAQFRLMECMIEKYRESNEIIEDLVKKY
jgi:Ser/Thr protein kinase RdoA (MazF antagonist)